MASESEQEKRDTLADIAAEMRTRSREVKEAFGGRPDGVENMLDIWADRIEAIAKREKAEAEANALVVGGIVEAAQKREREPVTGCHGFGNAAAMRETLVQCELFLGNVSRHGHPTLCLGDQCTACNGVDELRGMVVRALSAPARNCDVMSRSICTKHFSTTYEGNRDGLCDVQTEREKNIHLYYTELIDWLFAPAAERKGEDDGR